MLEKVKDFYRKKYQGFWDDLVSPKNRPLFCCALFLIAAGLAVRYPLKIIKERQSSDSVYEEQLRGMLHYDTPYYWWALGIYVAVLIWVIFDMRRRSFRNLSNQYYFAFMYIHTLCLLGFQMWLAYL